MTATLCTQPPSQLRNAVLDQRADARDFVVGEGAIRGLELQADRERLVPGPHLLAAVHVEQLEPRQQVAPALGDRRLYIAGRDVFWDHHGDVLDDRRETPPP